jgi:hypothetical protein
MDEIVPSDLPGSLLFRKESGHGKENICSCLLARAVGRDQQLVKILRFWQSVGKSKMRGEESPIDLDRSSFMMAKTAFRPQQPLAR